MKIRVKMKQNLKANLIAEEKWKIIPLEKYLILEVFSSYNLRFEL